MPRMTPQQAALYRQAVQVAEIHVIENRRILQLVGTEGNALAAYSVQGIAAITAQQTAGQMGVLIGAYADALARQVDGEHQKQMERIYRQIADVGQAAIVKRYKAMIRSDGLKYRGADSGKFKRYTGGIMLRALENDANLFRINSDGMSFVIAEKLDRVAPQWYRLNFGARPASTPPARESKIQFFGSQFKGASFASLPPSKAFRIPAGVWSSRAVASTAQFAKTYSGNETTGRAFYPVSKGAWPNDIDKPATAADWRYSNGIRGYRFLEEGLRVMNQQLGVGMEQMLREWVAEAADGKSSSPLKLGQADAKKAMTRLNEFYAGTGDLGKRQTQLRAATQRKMDELARKQRLAYNLPALPQRTRGLNPGAGGSRGSTTSARFIK